MKGPDLTATPNIKLETPAADISPECDSASRSALDRAISRSRDYHLSTQDADGFWVAELESNSSITSEYVFFLHIMGMAAPERVEKCARYLLQQQQKDGGWSLFHGGPSNVSLTVEAYQALKMAGVSPGRPEMVKARECVFSLGGIRATRVFTRIFLALLGQVSWESIPAMPAEFVLFPSWFYFNIYEMSSWSRGTVVPLTVVYAHQPVFPLGENAGIRELFTEADRDLSVGYRAGGLNWSNFFIFVDHFVKWIGKSPWKPFRTYALKKAKRWILEHQEPEGDFGGIQPPMIYSPIALKCLGVPNDHPVIVKGLEAIDRFIIDNRDHMLLQACVSPLWDTSIACNALLDSGLQPDHPALVKAAEWMLKKQVARKGDWKVKNPHTPPGGWAFEFFNEQYPDNDDTAEILIALDRIAVPDSAWKEKERQRALTWLLSMQSSNGGWAAFDQDNDHDLFNKIPFADHGAMLDPPTADVTGRVLWLLGRLGFPREHPQVKKALDFVKSNQEPDGCWFGRWGVNYIYGSFLVLNGLKSIGEDMRQDCVRKAVAWTKSKQNPDNGWGETCLSYTDPSLRGKGNSCPSQTAWAILGLVAAGEAQSDAARRGVSYLIEKQRGDGSWYEDEFTGTGFPGHFYIRYHMYRQFFPLMALARFRNAIQNGE
ncbi:MAG: squalene--hopene cyclase [Nitrospinae bacterium]|nr:squalene--hopene cyclase [Nitrospinota bacterium]